MPSYGMLLAYKQHNKDKNNDEMTLFESPLCSILLNHHGKVSSILVCFCAYFYGQQPQ